MQFNGCLDFDASLLIFKYHYMFVDTPVEVERLKFVNWVNSILNSIQSPTIEGLRVSFDVKSKRDIDTWVKFAVSKGAKSLELDLTQADLSTTFVGRYLFPVHLLCNSNFANSLSSLRLKNVDVTEEIISAIFIHCPFLEVLQVTDTPTLKRFGVPDPSINLKCLELIRCMGLEDVEVSGVNLLFFSFHGPDIDVRYKNVPRLVKVSIGGLYAKLPLYKFGQISAFCSQLETLILEVNLRSMCVKFPEHVPEFTNLKHFELWSVIFCAEYSFLPFTSLLKASPSLLKFTLTVMHSLAEPEYKEFENHLSENLHRCLKAVEVKGFVGSPAEMEILFHLFGNAPALEKLILDACEPTFLGGPGETLF